MEAIERSDNSKFSEEVMQELDSLRAIFEKEVTIHMVNNEVIKITFTLSEIVVVNIYINEEYPNITPTIKSNSKEMTEQIEVLADESIGVSMLYILLSKANDIFNKESFTEERTLNNQPKTNKDVESKEESTDRKKKQKQKGKKKENADEYIKKKKPMRTAIDVINRILWDESLQTDNFIVGYLDRFLGVQEKPFSAFSWEDIASVDYTVLAIPKHRIQYFKYKSVKIWDKNERFDKVFGSTDHAETLVDIVARDVDEDSSVGISACQNNIAEKQKETKREDKDRPNFFLCLPVNNDQIKLNIKKVQDHIISCDDRLEAGMIQQTCAHITLCMMRLDNEKDHEKAINVLKKLEEILICMLPLNNATLTVKRVDNFRGLVVYAVVEYNHIFQKFVEITKAKLKDAGIRLVGNYDPYTPHLTIMKLSRPMCKQLNIDDINPFLYKSVENIYFGEQTVNHLRICSTGKERGADDFYITIATVTNNLLCVSEQLPSLISCYVKHLMDAGLILEDIGDNYIAGLFSNDQQRFEATVIALEKIVSKLNIMPLKTVLILRGIPGSGKSYFVQRLLETADDSITNAVCSADEYFQSKTSYGFSGEEIANAHKYCRNKFIRSLQANCDVIIIDNTHSQIWEYQLYQRLAKLCGYKYHVLEMQCENDTKQQKFQKRCIHNVRKHVHDDMFSRWEVDLEAVRIDSDNTITMQHIRNSEFQSEASRNVLYSALYLDEASKMLLLKSFPPSHEIVTADHMTITYLPSSEQIEKLPVGSMCRIKVTGSVGNYCIQAVAVEEIDEKLCTLELSHVTISRNKETTAKYAQECLKNGLIQKPSTEIILSGVVGVQIVTGLTTSQMCTDPKLSHMFVKSTKKALKSNQWDNEGIMEKAEDEEIEEVGMYFGPEVVKSMFVFDFDGTLFHTPDPAEGRRDYERIMGVRWPYDGWLGQEASLQYPLFVYPGPTLKAYYDHHDRACSMSILLTGRMERLRKPVEEIATVHQMNFERRMLKPKDDRRKGNKSYGGASVYAYKKDYVASLLKEYTSVEELIFWDDRPDNIKKIRSLKSEFPSVKFNVINVQEKIPDMYKLTPEEMLDRMGKRPSQSYKAAVSEGLAYITKAWMSVLGTDTDQSSNILPFGSYVLERRTDVDLCILAPMGKSIGYYIEALGDVLKSFGVRYINVASGIRCPRLKIKFQYMKASPVEFDVVIATVLNDTNPCEMDTKTLYKSADSSSKTVLDGLVFIEDIVKPVEAKISLEDFGMLVDAVNIILSKNNLKGNAFHCIRTFHIVHMLSKFIDTCSINILPPEGITSMKTFEKVLFEFLRYLSKVNDEEWRILFKIFVPDFYIEPLRECFKHSCRSNSNIASLLFTAPKPTKTQNRGIQVQLLCKDPVELWKAMTITEARLGSCIRKLIERGFEVYPGSVSDNTILFDTSCREGSKKILNNFLQFLQKEFPENVKVQLRIDE